MCCSVVEVKGHEVAMKAIEILHRYEIRGRFMIVREVTAAGSRNLTEHRHSLFKT